MRAATVGAPYGAEALGRLASVRRARASGLTLGEARSILALHERGEAPCGHVAAFVASDRAGAMTATQVTVSCGAAGG